MFGHKKVPKILIVEDREVNHPLYKTVFELVGFEVSFISKIDDLFLEEVSQVAPDIIAMDLMIEDDVTQNPFAGFEMLSLLKYDNRTKNIPVMILTSFYEEGKVIKAKELGAVDFINVGGQSLKNIPKLFIKYLDKPEKYVPLHPIFRT